MASFTNAAKNAALDGLASYGAYVSLHTSDPGTTGAGELTGTGYARVQATWAASINGSKSTNQVTITVPASRTVTYYGIWTAGSAGGFAFGDALPAPETYGAQGTYQLTITITA